MILKINNRDLVVFDLDDTLYKEIEFLKSAYQEIASFIDEKHANDIYLFMMAVYQNRGDAFGEAIKKYKPNASKEELLNMYRNHFPDIKLEEGAKELIKELQNNGLKIGLITDGRSKTQRNKLEALEIAEIFDEVIISEEFGSEKPDFRNFNYFNTKFSEYSKTYIADNFKKDFITPKALGWKTIGLLDNGKNTHSQNIDLPEEYLPQNLIHSFKEIEIEYVK
jgi:putative hydrolase of the HAD superfamily